MYNVSLEGNKHINLIYCVDTRKRISKIQDNLGPGTVNRSRVVCIRITPNRCMKFRNFINVLVLV